MKPAYYAGFFYSVREKIENEKLQQGYSGTARTIERMHELVAKGKLDPTMHKIATWIRAKQTQDSRGKSKELADAVFWWVKKHGIFQRDPFQVERIEHPIASMRPIIEARRKGIYEGRGLFVGDCDLFSIWIATLGGLLGYQYAFETVKTDPSRPEDFSHIYTSLRVGGKWIPYDASTERATPGWRPPVPDLAKKIKVWPEKVMEETGVNGMGDDSTQNGYVIDPKFFQKYYSSGIPQYVGEGEPEVPAIDPGEFDVLPPQTPAIPQGDLFRGSKKKGVPPLVYTKKSRAIPPHARLPMDLGQSYVPYPTYIPSRGYLHAEQPTPPGWTWEKQVETRWGDGPEFPRATGGGGPYHAYRDISGGRGIYSVSPKGMGDVYSEYPYDEQGLGLTLPLTEEQKQLLLSQKIDAEVNASGDSAWTTIEGIINGVIAGIPDISQVLIDRTKARYQAKIAAAQERIAAAKKEQAGLIPEVLRKGVFGVLAPEKPWYARPLFLGGVALLGIGGVLLMTRRSSSSRRKRRKR